MSTSRPIVRAVVGTVGAQTSGTIRSCVVSMAGPVDRQTGQLAARDYAPFLVGEFAPKDVLRDLAPVVEVDNDVNWAALAERVHGNATDLDDFVLCYLGEGIGGAVVIDGSVVRGGRGRAGELAHARTTGPGGRSMTLFESLAAADLLRLDRRPSTWAAFAPSWGAVPPRDRRRAERDRGRRCRRDRLRGRTAGPPGRPGRRALGRCLRLSRPRRRPAGPAADAELVLRPTALTEAPYREGVRIRAVTAARQAVADDF